MKKLPSFKDTEADYMKMVHKIMRDHPVVKHHAMENGIRRNLAVKVHAALVAKTGNPNAGYTTLERVTGISRTQARRLLHVLLGGDLMLGTIIQAFDTLGIPLKDIEGAFVLRNIKEKKL